MKDLAGDIGDRKVPGNVRLTPESFTASLRPHQLQGVNLLQHLRELGLGGLLADDMGLGKNRPDHCPHRH